MTDIAHVNEIDHILVSGNRITVTLKCITFSTNRYGMRERDVRYRNRTLKTEAGRQAIVNYINEETVIDIDTYYQDGEVCIEYTF